MKKLTLRVEYLNIATDGQLTILDREIDNVLCQDDKVIELKD